LEAAAAALVTAAGAFGDDVGSYASKWTKSLLDTGSANAATGDFVVIDKCLDDPDCEECVKLEEAIKNVQRMMGSDWAGTAS
jgi:hypothetical protein